MYQHTTQAQHMLYSLRTRLLLMAAAVGMALEETGMALLCNDAERASAIIENDTAIDDMENEIDNMCLNLMARTQPVAGDLRFVVSALRMVVDLERIGDEAASIAEQAILMRGMPGCGGIPAVQEMFERARQAFQQATDIFRDGDAAAALAMRRNEDEALQCEVGIVQEIMRKLSEGEGLTPQTALHVILIARSLTRIWRRSVNMAEHVHFAQRGQSLKHQGDF